MCVSYPEWGAIRSHLQQSLSLTLALCSFAWSGLKWSNMKRNWMTWHSALTFRCVCFSLCCPLRASSSLRKNWILSFPRRDTPSAPHLALFFSTVSAEILFRRLDFLKNPLQWLEKGFHVSKHCFFISVMVLYFMILLINCKMWEALTSTFRLLLL